MMMIKPFRIVWELIEFGLQALFVYVLAIILCVALIIWFIMDSKKEQQVQHILIEKNESIVKEMIVPDEPAMPIYSKKRIEKVKECMRIDGCKVRKNGTVEW